MARDEPKPSRAPKMEKGRDSNPEIESFTSHTLLISIILIDSLNCDVSQRCSPEGKIRNNDVR
ncbi:hypothetical protein N7456_007126 [Penicillium angulare]|uniref:Uncharacterized protein n=1 Tax=Penicillium angulare TaxID=116970 RepID=A0A9W9FJ64_9EURO|nr:hypothetical protein N7456_007126 [Penicillium angulare]